MKILILNGHDNYGNGCVENSLCTVLYPRLSDKYERWYYVKHDTLYEFVHGDYVR